MHLSSNVLIILNFARQQLIKIPKSVTFPSSTVVSIFSSCIICTYIHILYVFDHVNSTRRHSIYSISSSNVAWLSFKRKLIAVVNYLSCLYIQNDPLVLQEVARYCKINQKSKVLIFCFIVTADMQNFSYTGPELQYIYFVHSLCLLGRLLIYKQGQNLFPVQLKNKKGRGRVEENGTCWETLYPFLIYSYIFSLQYHEHWRTALFSPILGLEAFERWCVYISVYEHLQFFINWWLWLNGSLMYFTFNIFISCWRTVGLVCKWVSFSRCE